MRQVDNIEALRIMRAGGECKATVLTYFVRNETLFYRDAKGVEHRSYTALGGFHNAQDSRTWTVVKEPPGQGPWVCGCVYEHGPNCGLRT